MKPDWRIEKLKNVCTVEREQATGQFGLYVGLEDIVSGTGRLLAEPVEKCVKSATFKFTPAHVLYGRLRPYLNKVLLPDFTGHCSTEIFPLRPGNLLDRKFLFFWLTWSPVVARIIGTSTGARMPRANMSEVMEFDIPLPPLEDQKRIVAILDEAFEGLARARENAEANLKNARELFVSFVRGAFLENETVWQKTTLPEICQNLDNKRIPITKSERVAGDTPYYGASGIVDYVRDYIFDEDLLLVSEDGANLLARTYPIAFSISGKTWVNNHAHVLRFETVTDQMFVELYLNSISLEPFVSGMAQPKLNQSSLNRIPIPFPPESERKSLVEKATAMFADTSILVSDYSERIEILGSLRQSLLHKAFSGELT